MKKIKVIAIVLAILTGLSVYVFAQSLQKDKTKDYVQVVVAAKLIPIRTTVTIDMLEMKTLPPEAAHPLATKKREDLVGMISVAQLEQGEQILASKFAKYGQATGGLAYTIPKGKRAMTIPTDNIVGIAGFIQPGDHVDVLTIMSITDKTTTQKIVGTALLLQNIQVLAAGKLLSENGVKNNLYDSITLAVTPQEMMKLNLASSEGKIRLVLREPTDEEQIKVAPQIIESMGKELFGQGN